MSSSDLSDSISRAIDRKCGSIVSLSILWKKAAATLLESGASEASAVSLIDGLGSARSVEALVAGVSQEGRTVDEFLSGLSSSVDESIYSIDAWLEAFERVLARLVEENRRASPTSILGYVQCTAEFASQTAVHERLPDLIQSMLDEYGFEGEEGCVSGGAE
ncbi:hypothetical protein [Pelagicoccus mobilis]|uniref:Uncharacterized protein n=1 Tax=Pelagicoccus mobilis TaxID=415221 RepID=A0A934S0Q1_9BACT|nr:hypothetical protein [Pelagicoccus mobilis]MBK1878416.1 hypothetical protein [Pelagicoccus mobilis]